MKSKRKTEANAGIPKAPTGIQGLDEITNGGFPAGRPTLICGDAGAGKTMMAAQFLVCGALEYNEPGVFMMFEENAEELTDNVRSLGFDLDKLVADGRLILDHVEIERNLIEETGDYDLEGLFIRIDHAVKSIGAKRVVLDTIEALFSGLKDHSILRSELRRLFRWLKDQGLTAVITAERGGHTLTRYGLEEYVADCVILLDHRVQEQISTRRLRVVKYRGSSHGTNEYPFLIGPNGFAVMPITSLRLDHAASNEFISLGVDKLDAMFAGGGVYRGSSILVSGAPGTGKSSLAASFVAAACERGERAILFSYEESSEQFLRNTRSIGLDLSKYIKKGMLELHASRPTLTGLEQHLVVMYEAVREFGPAVVAVDPISDLAFRPHSFATKPTLIRLIDFMKKNQITAMFTSLTSGGQYESAEDSEVGVSSLMDTWLLLRNTEYNGERNRTIFILKSRGVGHSNQVREFVLTDSGIDIVEVYTGEKQVLTGTARIVQTRQDEADREIRRVSFDRKLAEIEARRSTIEAKMEALRSESESAEHEVQMVRMQMEQEAEAATRTQRQLGEARSGSTVTKKKDRAK